MRRIGYLLGLYLVLVVAACNAYANNGTGTENFCERHGCGAPSGPVIGCPDVPTCPTTTCDGTTVQVTCPTTDVVFPNYYPCRRKKDGTAICPRRKTPHRVLMPEGSEYAPVR